MDLFACPLPEELADLPQDNCPIRWDQIQKFALQRRQATASFTKTTILSQSTWNALITASGDTKIVVTPYLNNVVIPQSELLTEGGNDNTTLNGIPVARGLGFAGLTAQMRNVAAAVADALRSYFPESAQNGFTDIWVYFFNKDAKIIGKDDLDDTHVNGFDLYNFIVSDVGSEGFGADNIYNIAASLAGGWSERHNMYKPSFNPLALSTSGS